MRAVVVPVSVDVREAEVVGVVEVEVEVLGAVRGVLSHSARGGLLVVSPAALVGLDYGGWGVGASLGEVAEGESEAHQLVYLELALPAERCRLLAGEEVASERLDVSFAMIVSAGGKAGPCLEVEEEQVAALATARTVVGPVGAVGVRRREVLWQRYLAESP